MEAETGIQIETIHGLNAPEVSMRVATKVSRATRVSCKESKLSASPAGPSLF